jgi:hypothetical protein
MVRHSCQPLRAWARGTRSSAQLLNGLQLLATSFIARATSTSLRLRGSDADLIRTTDERVAHPHRGAVERLQVLERTKAASYGLTTVPRDAGTAAGTNVEGYRGPVPPASRNFRDLQPVGTLHCT